MFEKLKVCEKSFLNEMILTLILFDRTSSPFLSTVATGRHSGMPPSPITEIHSVLGYAMKREPANSTVFSSKPIELLYVTVTKRHAQGEREYVPKECVTCDFS